MHHLASHVCSNLCVYIYCGCPAICRDDPSLADRLSTALKNLRPGCWQRTGRASRPSRVATCAACVCACVDGGRGVRSFGACGGMLVALARRPLRLRLRLRPSGRDAISDRSTRLQCGVAEGSGRSAVRCCTQQRCTATTHRRRPLHPQQQRRSGRMADGRAVDSSALCTFILCGLVDSNTQPTHSSKFTHPQLSTA